MSSKYVLKSTLRWDVANDEGLTLHDQQRAFDNLRKRTAIDCYYCFGLKEACPCCDGECEVCAYCKESSSICTCGSDKS